MTDTEILEQIQEDFRGVQDDSKRVTDSVNNLTSEISGMKVAVVNVEKTLDKHDERIIETREGQLLATRDVEVLNREMRDAKKAIANPGTAPVVLEDKTNGAILKKLFGRYKYWIVVIFLLIGFYIGSGGDEEKTLEFSSQVLKGLQKIDVKVEKIKQMKTEPIRVPVPVTASDMYLEEITP